MICLAEKVLAEITGSGNVSLRRKTPTECGLAHLSLTPVVSSVSWTCSCGVVTTWVFSDRRTAEQWASRICQGETGVVSGATAKASLTELYLPSGVSWSLDLIGMTPQPGRLGVRKVEGGKMCVDWEPGALNLVGPGPA